ncbi:MurR/RpiR family transcriptional regulator [Mesomycoplasma hyopneumoniae]|uniref:MurR/RpiR family transcriptional regulator n=1 Tax=Mesomycoplasma hyopneumoniae TaxID=2099 RepID=UPI000358FACA|nr:MurR/RpiR family transcriptional regulator [Mesomycoplasma hyopneumoniae]AGQ51173.1 hypothetical protein MHL_2094 [Mesomycoplasma hyopneumoniae 7422]
MNSNLIDQLSLLLKQNRNFIDKEIASFLLLNIQKIMSLKLEIIAKSANCSTASVIKFCKKLGFKGLKDLLPALDRNYSYLNFQKKRYSENKISQKNQILSKYHLLIMNNLDKIYNLNYNSMIKFVELLQKTRHIMLFGKGSNLESINIFANYLSKLQYHIDYHYDFEVQQKWTEKSIDSSVCVFFSFSGMHSIMDELVNKMKAKNCIIVAFTGNFESNLYKQSLISFLTFKNEDVLENHTSARISFIYLVMQIINLLKN